MTSRVKNVELINSQMKFKTTMLKSSLCDYSDAYILAKGRKQLLEQELRQQQYFKTVHYLVIA